MTLSRHFYRFSCSVLAVLTFAAGYLAAQDDETPTVAFPPPGGGAVAESLPAGEPVELQPIPLADFMRTPLIQAPQLNPAGTHIAALSSVGEASYQLVVRNLATKEDFYLGGGEVAMVDEFRWLGDDHIAYNLVTPNGADLGLMVTSVDKPESAYPIYQYAAARIVAVSPDRPLAPLVWVAAGTEAGGPAVVELDASKNLGGFVDTRGENAEAGELEVARRHRESIRRVVPLPDGEQLGYLPDHKGNLGFAYTLLDGAVVMHVWQDGSWVRSPLGFENGSVLDVGEAVGQLVMVIPGIGEPSQLRFVDALTGELDEVLLQDKDYDFNGRVFRDPASGAIVGAFYDRNGPTTVWFDDGYRELQKSLNGYFPGRVVRLVGVSNTGRMMLVAVSSDRDPVSYFTIDLEAKAISLVQGERPWLPGNRLSPTSILKYTTSDGKKLDAYVTLPAGTSKDNPAPLIALPHGGPWARTTWGFDSEAQLLASRGYAVIQPNYRGSTGYNWMFSPAERGDLLMMHDDVTQAVRTVIKTGMIDPDRIAISGGGFGGYLALTGLVEEPDLYACGATVTGIYDWQRLANELGPDRNGHPAYGALFQLLGDPGSEAARYDQISSGRRIDQIEDPLLVVRDGGGDSPEAKESAGLINDLLLAGVPYEVHNINESVLELETRVKLFQRMVDFFDQHLK